MRKAILIPAIPALMIGANLLMSPMALASADDEMSMYRFGQQACTKDPAQAGCFGFERAAPAATPMQRVHHATHDRHTPTHG